MTQTPPTVYVVQENPRINYTPAEKFGIVKFLTADEYSPSQHSIRNKRILEDVIRGLSNFDPDRDYIILSGNPIIMSFAFSLVLQRKGYVKALWYQSMDRDYVEVSFNPRTVLVLADRWQAQLHQLMQEAIIAASIINQSAYEDLKTMDRLRLTIELAQVLTDEFSRDKIESLSGKMQLSDMVRLQDQLNRSIDGLGESKSALQKTYDWIREGKLPELMEAQELDGLKVEGIGRVHLQSDIRASIKADNKAAAYEWLGDNGHGGLITETVNASSLKAFCKDKMKNGEELPEELFKTSVFTRAVITRK